MRGGGGGDRGGAQVVSVVGVPCLMYVWVLARGVPQNRVDGEAEEEHAQDVALRRAHL